MAFGVVRPALAATDCVGMVNGGAIKGNLIAAAGQFCELDDVMATGNITAKHGTSFLVTGGVIRGNVSVSGAADVLFQYVSARGSVAISSTPRVYISGSQVSGGVTISQSGASSGLDGYVLVGSNTFRSSAVHNDNHVRLNLVCDENVNGGIDGDQVNGQVIVDCPLAGAGN